MKEGFRTQGKFSRRSQRGEYERFLAKCFSRINSIQQPPWVAQNPFNHHGCFLNMADWQRRERVGGGCGERRMQTRVVSRMGGAKMVASMCEPRWHCFLDSG